MNFFEQELQTLFADGTVISGPTFSGRACLGTLGKDLRVRAQFITTGIADHFDALKITVLNRTDGPVDSLKLRFQDDLGKKVIPGNPNFADGIVPHIWKYNDKVEWYAYQPTQADRKKICQAVGLYLDAFRERQAERAQDGPKLVYICAPLRGDLEINIEFARRKAQEVFQNGDLPICPHLLFPPIADATDPVQDTSARDMGLRLVESCQQVNVYGPERTAGMQAEIDLASRLHIPILVEQKAIDKASEFTSREISVDRDMDFSRTHITAYVEIWFDVSKRFGLALGENDSCDLYVLYCPSSGNCEAKLCIRLHDGSEEWRDVTLSVGEKSVVVGKMEAVCKAEDGKSLLESWNDMHPDECQAHRAKKKQEEKRTYER